MATWVLIHHSTLSRVHKHLQDRRLSTPCQDIVSSSEDTKQKYISHSFLSFNKQAIKFCVFQPKTTMSFHMLDWVYKRRRFFSFPLLWCMCVGGVGGGGGLLWGIEGSESKEFSHAKAVIIPYRRVLKKEKLKEVNKSDTFPDNEDWLRNSYVFLF